MSGQMEPDDLDLLDELLAEEGFDTAPGAPVIEARHAREAPASS